MNQKLEQQSERKMVYVQSTSEGEKMSAKHFKDSTASLQLHFQTLNPLCYIN